MKIVHTISSIANKSAGPSYSVTRLCKALIENNNQVNLLTVGDDVDYQSESFEILFRQSLFKSRLFHSVGMYNWLKKNAYNQNIDILHSHSLWTMPNIYPSYISYKNKIPLFYSPRGTLSKWAFESGSFAKKIFWPLFQKKALERVSCFHATAYSEYEDIRKMGFTQPVAIIPNGIDIHKTKYQKSHQKNIIFLGRIHKKKGLDILINAWALVEKKYPDWQLTIAGPDNYGYLDFIKLMTSDLGLERVSFVGELHGEAKFRAYGEANIFVLPTYSENFAMTVAEALMMGTPAIVSKGAPWEGLIENKAGWWIDIGVEPLFKCFNEALKLDRSALIDLGLNGSKWMEKDFSWPEITSMMIRAYKWSLGRADKPDFVIID